MKKLTALMLAVLMILQVSVFTVFAQEDITTNPMTFPLNTKTIQTAGSYVQSNSNETYVVLSNGGYAEYIVNTEKAGSYDFTLYSGAIKDGIYISVSVNGTTQIEKAPLTTTGGHMSYTNHALGTVTLQAGENRILITNLAGSSEWVVAQNFQLTSKDEEVYTEDILHGAEIFPMNTTTYPDYASTAWPAQCSANYITLNKGKSHYLEYTVNTKENGTYQISLDSGAYAGTLVNVSVNEKEQLSNVALPNVTGGYQTWAPQPLGNITLTKGANTIRVSMASSSAYAVVIRSFVLAKVTGAEDITADTTVFPLNNTVVDLDSADSNNSAADCVTMQKYFTGSIPSYIPYAVNTQTEQNYILTINSGTSGTATKMTVFVNDEKVINNVSMADTGGFQNRDPHELGIITLKPGLNLIRFQSSGSATVSTQFSLTKLNEDITANPMVFPLNKNTADISHADAKNSNDKYATMQNGQYIEYTVNTIKDAYYLLTFTCSTNSGSSGSMDVSLNGNLVLDDAPMGDTGGHSDAKRMPHELGVIHLTPGKNMLKFQVAGTAAVSTKFALSKTRLAQTVAVNGASADANINILEAGTYGVTAKITSAENGVVRVTANGKAVAGVANGAGNIFLGNIDLAEGTQNVKVTTASGTAQIESVLFSDVEYDVSKDTTEKTFFIDKETVETAITEGASSLAMTAGTSFTLSVNAEKAICYNTSVTKSGTGKFTVNVNGYDQITNAESGVMNLNRGMNTVTFTLTEGEAVVEKVTLTQTDSFKNGSFTAWAQKDRVADSYFVSSTNSAMNDGFYTSGTTKCTTMRDGTWLEFDVYTAEDRYVNMSFRGATPDEDGAFSVFVNGETQMKEVSTGAVSSAYGIFAICDMEGMIYIPAGYNTVRMQYHKRGINVEYFTLSDCGDDILQMENFRVVTEDGGRLPFVVKDGFTAYAKVDVLKIGNPTGEYRLMLAQYAEDKSLVDVSITEIDVSKMADKERKTFTAPLTYKGNGGWVKAFLVEKDTVAPLEKSIMYQDNLYFDEDVLNETASYTDITNVLNGAGEYYEDRSIHDENYDIDAIFYDSVVGEQSKVFAFIGVPKGASEENPVPAVVCVHGGQGVAFSDWVKLWNDKGYAAIAMTLTGDGPESSPLSGVSGSLVSDNLHPYAGQHCWGEAAFRADYENAAMYQNVLNVIRAHNVLRSYPGVDENNIGITGISWGGVTTTTVIGVDNRFKFAVPVYGCGYLDESETYFSDYFKRNGNTIMWDPANFAARSTVPTLYVNSDSDEHFSINSTTKSVGVTDGSRMSIRNKYGHGYTQGWAPAEIYTFADGMINGYDPFITITSQKAENGTFTATYTAPDGITAQSAVLYYITKKELPYAGNITWNEISAGTIANGNVTFTLPDDATFCYATVTDNNGSLISSKYIEVK